MTTPHPAFGTLLLQIAEEETEGKGSAFPSLKRIAEQWACEHQHEREPQAAEKHEPEQDDEQRDSHGAVKVIPRSHQLSSPARPGHLPARPAACACAGTTRRVGHAGIDEPERFPA